MKKTIVWILIVALVCVGGYFGYRFIRRRAALRAAAQDLRNKVAQAKVERRDLEVVVTGKGTVQANVKKNVQPGVAGTVSRVLVEEGGMVQSGEPILYLTNDSVVYQAEQARLDLSLAQQALLDLTGPAGGKAKAELNVRSAETDLEAAEDRVAALTIESAIGGEVWDLAVKEGDSVKAGQTVATIGDTSAFEAAIRVPQADVSKIGAGLSVSISTGGAMAPMVGVVTSVGKEGSSSTTTSGGRTSTTVEFPVTVAISDPDPDLRAGMWVNVSYTDEDGWSHSFPGSACARDRRDVKAEVDGTVVSVSAIEGGRVSEGQILVTLENNSVLVARDQALNALDSARQTLASFQNTIDSQTLKVESARIAYEDKLEAVSKLTVRSPVDGKVLSCSVEVGDEVTANQNVASVGQVSPLVVVIPVDELDVANVSVGQPVRIEIDAFPGEEFVGTVQKIAQEGTVQQGITNYSVTVELESQVPRLGMSATATIAVAQKTQVLTVPVEALKWEQGQAYVNVWADGQVTQKRVKIGVQGDLYAEVVTGLNEGETILVGDIPENNAGFGAFRMPGQGTRINIPAGGR